MTLKNLLKMVSNRMKFEKKQEKKKQIDKQCYNRSENDIKIIDNYLYQTILSISLQNDINSINEGRLDIGKSEYIRLWAFAAGGKLTSPKDESGNSIFLDDGTKLIIGQSDIVRFCKKHSLKLVYYYHKYVRNSYISKKYDYNIVDDFLIKIN